jgi:hypothetical protein
LIGNILSFAKGIEWDIDREIEVMITHLPKWRLFSFKDHQMVGIDFMSKLSYRTLLASESPFHVGSEQSERWCEDGRDGIYR